MLSQLSDILSLSQGNDTPRKLQLRSHSIFNGSESVLDLAEALPSQPLLHTPEIPLECQRDGTAEASEARDVPCDAACDIPDQDNMLHEDEPANHSRSKCSRRATRRGYAALLLSLHRRTAEIHATIYLTVGGYR